MPIQILPARLANQIAAGEVVERPASVVKELVENSLDSTATQIDVEIEKGGHKRIVIRDNGSGIPQSELPLALSRHATSKITTLDDLEHIASLGFRGEALASISSVARLVLSSKPAEQAEAWQAHCEGRDMAVQLNPVAHPNGTSVDVSDLFFNTPARRKFLRAEKTEFTHIDEVIRRIALSRFDVGFSLKHNGKLLRKYPVADSPVSKQRRLIAICGKDFGEQAIELNSAYQDFCLTGWLASPDNAKPQPECQYFYVNGRMMRDKLLNHAVRQALEGVISPEHQLAYVLYFTLDLTQVDVNVHPAKHEVRFHQSRLVHDFIFRALSDALNQYFSASALPEKGEALAQTLSPVEPNHSYIQPLQSDVTSHHGDSVIRHAQVNEQKAQREYSASNRGNGPGYNSDRKDLSSINQQIAGQNYQALMRAPINTSLNTNVSQHNVSSGTKQNAQGAFSHDDPKTEALLGSWMQINEQQLLLSKEHSFYLIDIKILLSLQLMRAFSQQMPVSQPLLLPVSFAADAKLLEQAERLHTLLNANSIDITWQAKRIIIRKIPAGMRHYNWVPIIEALLVEQHCTADALRLTLCRCLAAQQPMLNQTQISQLLQDYSQFDANVEQTALANIAKKIPLNEWLSNHA